LRLVSAITHPIRAERPDEDAAIVGRPRPQAPRYAPMSLHDRLNRT
jgi:hypothetical protein